MEHIFIYGPPGSGKSTLGERLAQALSTPFYDLDELIVAEAGVSIPEIFAAEDHGPTPVEFILVGLSSCLTAGVASVAQNRGVQLNSVKSTLEGDMDLAGILGIDRDVRNGYSGIRVTFEIDADATAEEIETIVEQSRKRSAVYDVVSNPVDVSIQVV